MKTAVLRGGPPVHPTVYSKRVMRWPKGARDGEVVKVTTREGRACGYAFFHSSSQLALRMLTFDPKVEPDDAWLAGKLQAANALRTDVLRLPAVTNAWRVAHAEADGLPGLIIDRFDDVVVLQLYSVGWYRRLDELLDTASEVFGVQVVLWGADERIAEQEGIPLDECPVGCAVEVVEHGVRYLVDAGGGHKTGFFLDQRDNRKRVMDLAAGRYVFDGMSYTGGFGLAAAKGGAARVVGMDLDEEAVARAQKNARLNDLDVDFQHGDVFDALRKMAALDPTERPDLLSLDPPKWVRDRKGMGAGIARYGDLNRLALAAVKPGGLVFTHSCSGLIDEPGFLSVIRNGVLDVGADARFLFVGGAGMDHPVATNVPEGRYLKSALFVTDGPGSGPTGGGREGGDGEAQRGGDRKRDTAPRGGGRRDASRDRDGPARDRGRIRRGPFSSQ